MKLPLSKGRDSRLPGLDDDESASTSETVEFAAVTDEPDTTTDDHLGQLVTEATDRSGGELSTVDLPSPQVAAQWSHTQGLGELVAKFDRDGRRSKHAAADREAPTLAFDAAPGGQTPTLSIPEQAAADGASDGGEVSVDDYYGSGSLDETAGVIDDGQVRPPVVGGSTGGVGTSTVAEVIGGIDLGKIDTGAGCDVLVARSNVVSLRRAAQLLGAFPASAGRPVLVVVPDGPGRMPSAVTAWVRILKGQVSSLVLVEWVPQMRMLNDPVVAVADALNRRKPPKWARQYYELLSAARSLAQYRLVPDWDPATDIAR